MIISDIWVYLIPVIMIGSVLLIIFSFTSSNKKLTQKLFTIGFLTVSIFMFIFMGIIIPFSFLSAVFKEGIEFFYFIGIIFLVWLIFSCIFKFKNYITLILHPEKNIYIRDITVKYSPAVLSYLMNNKIETKKDLSATLLNLCVNKVLKINQFENGQIEIIDLNNLKAVGNLTKDEYYAYNMFKTGVTLDKISIWKNIVQREYSKYNFSKKQKRNLGEYLFWTYIFIFLVLWIYVFITGNNELSEIFAYILVSTFFGAWIFLVFSSIKTSIFTFIEFMLNKDDNLDKKLQNLTMYSEKSGFVDSLTQKGALEYNRWKKFEKFIEDFTLIKQRDYQAVEILGKYLSYSIALGINTKCDSELYDKINVDYNFNLNKIGNLFNY